MRAVLFVLCLSFAVLGCQKPTHEECKEICMKGNVLGQWERFERETADLTPEEKAERKVQVEKQIAEIEARKHDPGLENCVTDCRQGGRKSDVECVRKAKTTAEVKDCIN